MGGMRHQAAFVSIAFFMSALAQYAAAQTALPDHAVQQPFQARVTIATGQVTRIRDQQPWTVNQGERIPVRQTLETGSDGYAHLELAGGSSFDLFANSKVIFRQNTASEGDLLDVLSGRVRLRLHPTWDQPLQRIYTPTAIITTDEPAVVSLAVDEDDTVRVDVMEGEVKVQHTLLPRTSPVLVRAIDAVLVQPDQPISYRVDRGSLYRYTVKPIVDLWFALTPGGSRESETTTKFLAEADRPARPQRFEQ